MMLWEIRCEQYPKSSFTPGQRAIAVNCSFHCLFFTKWKDFSYSGRRTVTKCIITLKQHFSWAWHLCCFTLLSVIPKSLTHHCKFTTFKTHKQCSLSPTILRYFFLFIHIFYFPKSNPTLPLLLFLSPSHLTAS